MYSIQMENIRSFNGEHTIPVRPLTIVTGENSSGKSTFLAVLSTLFDSNRFPLHADFNKVPFSLGSFGEIISHSRGNQKKPEHISIGFNKKLKNGTLSNTAKYVDGGGKVQLIDYSASSLDINFNLKFNYFVNNEVEAIFESKYRDEENYTKEKVKITSVDFLERYARIDDLIYRHYIFKRNKAGEKLDRLYRPLATLFNRLHDIEAKSLSPIRTHPARTYDYAPSTYQPAGDHIPYVLERLLAEDGERSRNLLERLNEFGSESGLFSKIIIKKLGKKAGSPFQLQVAIDNNISNIIDVGYGISQVLPVVVELLLLEETTMLLAQQPEVHLHPASQAALGSLFGKTVMLSDNYLVVETHSDYIINRIRLDIARERLDPSKVQLLYFERTGRKSRVHPIEIDAFGNLINAPKGYRKFFIQEELSLITRSNGLKNG